MNEEVISEKPTGTEPETLNNEPLQTPLEQEIDRETKKNEGRSEAEKAAFSLKKNYERAKELGVPVEEVLGITPVQSAGTPKVDKDTPLTVGMYEEMQKNVGKQNALQMAESLTDEREKTLVIQYLKNRIVPSGDPADDLRFARLAVNSLKNEQVVGELSRGVAPRNFSSGAGAPPKQEAKEPELTASEQQFTKPPFSMTPAQIIAARSQ